MSDKNGKKGGGGKAQKKYFEPGGGIGGPPLFTPGVLVIRAPGRCILC